MVRYNISGRYDDDGDEIPPVIEKDKEGYWCQYNDVKVLENKIAGLEKELALLKEKQTSTEDNKKLEDVELYAWLGEDEYGSGEIGIKQAKVPVGIIPLVSTRRDRMDQDFIREQLDNQGKTYGKKIMLCKYTFAEVVLELGEKPCLYHGPNNQCPSTSPKRTRIYCGDAPCKGQPPR